jgi:anti-sigma factor RsiW
MEQHLADCQDCRGELERWQNVAAGVQERAEHRAQDLPPLSAVLRANLQPQPTALEAFRASLNLIRAQHAVTLRGPNSLATLVFVLLALLAASRLEGTLTALPLLIALPVVAALYMAFLSGPKVDPTYELVAATSTPAATLVFSRLTLVLAFLVGLALPGGLAVGLLTGYSPVFLTAAWLGPMLLLAALTTLLALLWRPAVAAGVTLSLWAGVVALFGVELQAGQGLRFSLLPLLQPGFGLFMAQLLGAGLLWWLAWRLLEGGTFLGRFEARA